MKLNWKSLISLKTTVIVTFILTWNAGFFLAMYLGGGGLGGGVTPIGMQITGYVCLAAFLFSISVAVLKPVQTALIEPTRAVDFSSREFYFFAFVTGVLAVSRFFLIIDLGSNAL